MRTALAGVAFALGLLISPVVAQQDDTIYKPGDGVSSPRLLHDVKPQYTAGAMRRGVNGSMLLRCVVDRDGVPTRLEVVRSLDDELDRASLDALKQWRFAPGQKDGRAVLVQVEVIMAFSTPDTKKPAETKSSLWKRLFWRK